jgi:MFS family permease
VPREDLPSAVSLGTGVWSISQVLAPAASGVILAVLGAGPCYFVTAAGFWTSATLLSFVRLERRERTTGASALHEIRDGLSYVGRNPIIRSLLAISVTIGAFGYGAFVLMPVFAEEVLDVGSVGYGAMQAVVGAGGIVGTLWAAALGYSRHRGRVLVVSAASFGALMVGFGLSGSFPLTLALLVGVGFADGMFINLGMTVAQSMLPDELRGRVMGLWGVTWFIPPLGGILGGTLAGRVGAPATVAGFGSVVAVMAFAVGIPGTRRLGDVAPTPLSASAEAEAEPVATGAG